MKFSTRTLLAVAALAGALHAQAPADGPLVLLVPVSARATALGNASVRDDYSIFYNPARIAATNGIGVALARYGGNGTFGALASGVNVGPLNWGWGVEVLQFHARNSSAYPYAPAELVADGTRLAMSLAAVIGAEYTLKGFNIGVDAKFAEEHADAVQLPQSALLGFSPIQRNLLLADAGTTHALLGGTAEFVVQNIGDRGSYPVPMTEKLGYTRSLNLKQIDLAFAGEVLDRQGWIGGGGGAELGYGWIEGFSAVLRAGARRPETAGQRPVAVGGTLNADRLQLDYALEFFEGNRYAHHLTVRWR